MAIAASFLRGPQRAQGLVLHTLCALSANRGARPLVPRRRTSLKYPASVMFTGATFGSTRVTDQTSTHSAATAASVGASSLTMPPWSMVPRCEAVFPSERKEEKCYLEDRMKTVFVSTYIRALAANECVFVWLLHSGRASKALKHQRTHFKDIE